MTLIQRLDYKGIYTQKMHLLRLTELNAALPAEYVYPVHLRHNHVNNVL